jgi:hypothetical protein
LIYEVDDDMPEGIPDTNLGLAATTVGRDGELCSAGTAEAAVAT